MACDVYFRYLSEFVYFLSLHIDKSRASFIHIPVLNSPYTIDQLVDKSPKVPSPLGESGGMLMEKATYYISPRKL